MGEYGEYPPVVVRGHRRVEPVEDGADVLGDCRLTDHEAAREGTVGTTAGGRVGRAAAVTPPAG